MPDCQTLEDHSLHSRDRYDPGRLHTHAARLFCYDCQPRAVRESYSCSVLRGNRICSEEHCSLQGRRQTMKQRMFIIVWSVIGILITGLCVIVITSLIPYYNIVGKMALVVVAMALLCLIVLMFSFTKSRVSIWHNRERLIIAGDVVAYINQAGLIENLTAQNYAAQIAPNVTVRQIAPPAQQVEQDTSSDEDTVRDLIVRGTALKSIAESTGWTYYRVQKLYAQMKESNEI